MTSLARLEHVTRRFGDVTAVNDVTLDIPPGEMLGLLGPNGAGKSTLISLLQGGRRATSGSVTLFGGDPKDALRRRLLGSTPQETALPEALRVGEVIDFVGAHFETRVPTAELAAQFGLGSLLKRQTGSLSGGQKRRVAVALAFVGRPKLVLLDEPTTGLDVDARHSLWQELRAQHDAGVTIVVTSHYLEEIEALADRVVILSEGRIIADDSLHDVLARVSVRLVRLQSSEPDAVAALPGVIRRQGETYFVNDSDKFLVALVSSGHEFHDLTVRGATLEEAFITLTESSVTRERAI